MNKRRRGMQQKAGIRKAALKPTGLHALRSLFSILCLVIATPAAPVQAADPHSYSPEFGAENANKPFFTWRAEQAYGFELQPDASGTVLQVIRYPDQDDVYGVQVQLNQAKDSAGNSRGGERTWVNYRSKNDDDRKAMTFSRPGVPPSQAPRKPAAGDRFTNHRKVPAMKEPVFEREVPDEEARRPSRDSGRDCPYCPISDEQQNDYPEFDPILDDVRRATQALSTPTRAGTGISAGCSNENACKFTTWSKGCGHFINERGEFGDWGKMVLNHLDPLSTPAFFRKDLTDMGEVCPRFNSMDDSEKKAFWVWAIAAMANSESSCNPNITATGPNGTVAGLLQLHQGKEHLYGSRANCPQGMNVFDPAAHIKCSIEMLNKNIARTQSLFVNTTADVRYWEVLKANTASGKKTFGAVSAYSGCRGRGP